MSKIIGRPLYAPAPAGGGKPSAPKFTYDGDYVIRDDGVVELLTSGTLVFLNTAVIDIFMVGGGSSGAYHVKTEVNKYTGGNGGYTRTIKRVTLSKGVQIPVTIGAGGTNGSNGGSSTFNELTVNGGTAPSDKSSGEGGSGGGAGGWADKGGGGTGGSDGSNGTVVSTSYNAGTGQGSTTREFGETTGKLYAGGGGGASYASIKYPKPGAAGGDGGGGRGAGCGEKSASANIAGTSGVANTGGGGGGGGQTFNKGTWIDPGSGGSGIVCIREAQELPELAGTWVLNERLYMPERYFTENVRFTGVQTGIQGSVSFVEAQFYYARGTKQSLLRFAISSSNIKTIYDFTENKWSERYQTITFLPSATASDEFRAWLVSNATKQTA